MTFPATETQTVTADRVTGTELGTLLTIARRLAGPSEAEDLAHDAWMALQAKPTASPDHGWLAGLVRNRWRMHKRSDRRRVAREQHAHAEPSASLSPEVATHRAQLYTALGRALDQLDPSDRQLITERYLDERSAAQLADRMGIPASTVRTRLSRVMSKLRAAMDDHCDGDRSAWAVCFVGPLDRPLVSTATATATTTTMGIAIKTSVAAGLAGLAALTYSVTQSTESSAADERPVASRPEAPTKPPLRHNKASAVDADRGASSPEGSTTIPISPASLATLMTSPEADDLEIDINDLLADIAQAVEEGHIAPDEVEAFQPLATQALESYMRCTHDSDSPSSERLRIRIKLLSGPEVDADAPGVVDTITVLENVDSPPETVECLRESFHTIDFSPPSQAVYDTYDFSVSEGTASIGGAMTPDNIVAILDRYPSNAADLKELVQSNEGMLESVRTASREDPAFVERHPEYADLVQ